MKWQSISNWEPDARETYLSVPQFIWRLLIFMQAMLLAAGLGTRLRPYTLVRPKPLFPVLNRPLLDILLGVLCKTGAKRIVVNGHHLGNQIEEFVRGKKEVLYQFEPEILGTGGSLRQALPGLDDTPLLVMNGDIFHNIDLAALYANHVRSGNRITMAVHDCPRFNTVGVRNGCISTFSAGANTETERLAFTGIHVVDPSIIEMIPAGKYYHIIDLYEKLLRQGEKIGVLRVDGSMWKDIGTPEDYLALHARLLSGADLPPLPVEVPGEGWLVSSRVKMPRDIQLTGWGCIGNAKIESGVHLHNCVVWDDSVLESGTCLADRIVVPN